MLEKIKVYSFFFLILLSCTKDITISNIKSNKITIGETVTISSITFNSAVSGGNVVSSGIDEVLEKGVCWNTTGKPSILDYKTVNGSGLGSFSSTLSNLLEGTRYYVRSFARTKSDVIYGSEISFSTALRLFPPTIILQKINFISGNSANIEGDLTSNGGSQIIERGFCWSNNPNPTIINNRISGTTIIGLQKTIISNLVPNSTYYIRAFARNAIGISYSSEKTFKTLGAMQISDVEGNVYNTVQIGSQIWMKESLKTTTFNDGTQIPVWSTYFGTGYNYYANIPANGSKYGLIYKYYTMADPKGVCPVGWHVPSDTEWNVLINFLGGPNIAADKMKESGQANWIAPTSPATNSSGFTALPGGSKDCSMNFVNLGRVASFWSSEKVVGGLVKGISLSNNSSAVSLGGGFDCNAAYIRCIKD
jgi:uncharacterized protein (TIGR02145 family)